jgi:hypothetical protein
MTEVIYMYKYLIRKIFSKLFSVYVKRSIILADLKGKWRLKTYCMQYCTVLYYFADLGENGFQKMVGWFSHLFPLLTHTTMQGYLQFGLGRGASRDIYTHTDITATEQRQILGHGPKVCVCNYRFLACGYKVSLVRNLSNSGFELHVF